MPLKIYKPKHVIKESENVGVKEIPLAFIDADDNECAVEIRLEEPFAKDGKRRNDHMYNLNIDIAAKEQGGEIHFSGGDNGVRVYKLVRIAE